MNPSVLIVEDHDTVRASLREWLGLAFPGWAFLEAKSGEEALDLACAQHPALVLMDIGLPKMNGIEATRRIKAALPSVSVVILTIYEDEAYRADAALAGASAYVAKRKMQSELVPVLTALLSESAGTPHSRSGGR